jgi:predicted nucleic acid-binding protein
MSWHKTSTMRAVSNTSPISNLAIIGQLSLLKIQFSEILIPSAVLHELNDHPDSLALAAIQAAIRDNWIKPTAAPSSHLLGVLLPQLHRGEAEAIALAAEVQADILLIDEQEGRQWAAHSGLLITGVLGILLRAKKTGRIPALAPEIQSLRAKARFFIAPSLEATVLAAAGE